MSKFPFALNQEIADRNKIIKKMYEDGESQTSIGKKFGMSQATISNIVRNPMSAISQTELSK
jgi:DNA-binding NarL/FixJ family response regulator